MVTLTPRSRGRLVLACNGLLIVGIVLAAAYAVWPIDPRGPAGGLAATRPAAATPAGPAAGPLSAYAVVHARDLRKPLYDPEPIKVVATKPAEPDPPVQLIGTVIDTSASFGLFRAKGGQDRFAGVGETVEGAEVLAVAEGSATLRFRGRDMTPKVPKEEKNDRTEKPEKAETAEKITETEKADAAEKVEKAGTAEKTDKTQTPEAPR